MPDRVHRSASVARPVAGILFATGLALHTLQPARPAWAAGTNGAPGTLSSPAVATASAPANPAVTSTTATASNPAVTSTTGTASAPAVTSTTGTASAPAVTSTSATAADQASQATASLPPPAGAALAPPPGGGPLVRMALAGGVGSFRTVSARAATSLTAAGQHIAPRYMTGPGDVDVSALGGLVGFPSSGGGAGGAQLSLQARVLDGLTVLADLGPHTALGLRGPLWSDDALTLGWDARYRSDAYFYLDQGWGLVPSGFGLAPVFPGTAAHGGQIALDGEYALGPARIYLAPAVAVLGNRSSVGTALGADWDLDRVTLGYGADLAYNAVNPGGATSQAFEQAHALGLRYYLSDWSYLQANYRYQVADAYGEPSHTLLLGAGTRLAGNFRLDDIRGRVYHSLLPDGVAGWPLKVELKIRRGAGWVDAPQTATTDAQGHYSFNGLPPGDYQVVHRGPAGIEQVAGAAVADTASTQPGQTQIRDLDIAWDESAIKGTIKGRMVEVSWPAKPGIADPVYQVILKYAPEEPYIVGTPPSADTTVRLEVSREVAARRLYYTVKYWKRGGQFEDVDYYGQSSYRILEVQQ